jgi:hypothetical protein
MSNTCLYSISKPKSKKIRRKRATVAPYSILYRFLCNALQRASQKPKKYGANAPQLHHILAGIVVIVRARVVEWGGRDPCGRPASLSRKGGGGVERGGDPCGRPSSPPLRRRHDATHGGLPWGPLRSPWGRFSCGRPASLPLAVTIARLSKSPEVVNPLDTCDNEKTGAKALEEI